jgi:hypothetical protein
VTSLPLHLIPHPLALTISNGWAPLFLLQFLDFERKGGDSILKLVLHHFSESYCGSGYETLL